MAVGGADGCKGGWFAVRLEADGTWQMEVFADIDILWQHWSDASLILLDVPIGLTGDKKGRQCDRKARHLLRQRHVTVFTPPCRDALRSSGDEEASMTNCRVTGRKLPSQTRGILRRIGEVDDFLLNNREARSKVREVHPEVCFWAFNNFRPMPNSKKTPAGQEERVAVLRTVDERADPIVDQAVQKFPRRGVARDDILDALAAALTADGPPQALVSIPREPEWDSRGLRMEMVYRWVR